MSASVRSFAYIPQFPLDPRSQPRIFGDMNTTQTNLPSVDPASHPLLADFDDPDLTTPDLARRHNLTLDQLAALTAAPAFQHALALLRALNQLRRPLQLARAHAQAAQTLTTLAQRTPSSATAAKEARLAIKDLLKLLTDPDPLLPRACGGGGTRSVTEAASPLNPSPNPNPTPPPQSPAESGAVAAPAPTPQTNNPTQPAPPQSPRTPRPTPKRPRNTKPRPKARSR